MKQTCKQCQSAYETTDRRRKFCSLLCYWTWSGLHKNAGRFKKGAVPWNVGTKGVVKANSGSFKKGNNSGRWMPVGRVTIRTDKQKRNRAWVKIRDTGHPSDWILRSVVKWEKYHSPIPKGCLIHHKDRDTLNDLLGNLQMMTRAEHLMEHRPEFEHKRNMKASIAVRRRHAENRNKRSAVAQAT